jgi:hypothetical protein
VNIPNGPSLERERAILDIVRAGKHDPITWCPVRVDARGHSATIYVTSDALKIGGVRYGVSAYTQQLIADLLDASLPTSKVCDVSFDHADVRVPPCLQKADALMGTTAVMEAYSRQVDEKIAGRTGLARVVCKDWILNDRILAQPGCAANYGFYDARAPYTSHSGHRMWQTVGTRHGAGSATVLGHSDYSQCMTFVRNDMLVDGQPMRFADVLGHAEFAWLISEDGVMRVRRMPGVPHESAATAAEPPPVSTPIGNIITPVLRRGSSGLAVSRWQTVLGVTADGSFGPKTEAATKAWQAAHGLTADGIVGAKSWASAASPVTVVAPVAVLAGYPVILAKNFHRGRTSPVRAIVLHSTESSSGPGSARAVAAWFAGAQAPMASSHFVVDSSATIRCVADEDVAFAAPGLNDDGIQIEICGRANYRASEWPVATVSRVADLVAELLKKYSLPADVLMAAVLVAGKRGITTHLEVSRAYKRSTHTDPGPGWPMAEMLKMVAARA